VNSLCRQVRTDEVYGVIRVTVGILDVLSLMTLCVGWLLGQWLKKC